MLIRTLLLIVAAYSTLRSVEAWSCSTEADPAAQQPSIVVAEPCCR